MWCFRLWPAPKPWHMVTAALPEARQQLCRMNADLCAAPLAFLRDHCVSGVPLLPAAAVFEMAGCAARMLTGTPPSELCKPCVGFADCMLHDLTGPHLTALNADWHWKELQQGMAVLRQTPGRRQWC